MRNTIALILGGGRGTRLYPLTKFRSKPAVPIAGKYRLIDIPLSNCINSDLKRIYVLTQFNSVSLHRHIRQTYRFSNFEAGFVEILAAQQTLEQANWYQGTADAVRQNLRYIDQPGVDYVLVLSGDQLYRMDYRRMLATHQQHGADVTIAALPVDRRDASSLGIMRVDDQGRVTGFLEKPQTEDELSLVLTDPKWIDCQGIASGGRDCLASMGIYLFNRSTLVDVLTKTDYQDFGKEVFPASIRSRHVQAYLFDGYWEDIGTIRSFFHANLDLADRKPKFDLDTPDAPIYTRARYLPPMRVDQADVRHSLVAEGCVIGRNVTIENSVIGLRCQIADNVTIRNSIVMGADFFPSEAGEHDQPAGEIPVGIGAGTRIENAIVDKNVRIGHDVIIRNEASVDSASETNEAMIADGIVVIKRGAVLPDGWRFEPSGGATSAKASAQ